MFEDINDIYLRACFLTVNLTKGSAQENREPYCSGCFWVDGSEHVLLRSAFTVSLNVACCVRQCVAY